MLNPSKRYFVGIFGHGEIAIGRWANQNGMKLGETVMLPTCGLAYKLDVAHNDKLDAIMDRTCAEFRNGEDVIGEISYDLCGMEICVVVHPEIKK